MCMDCVPVPFQVLDKDSPILEAHIFSQGAHKGMASHLKLAKQLQP